MVLKKIFFNFFYSTYAKKRQPSSVVAGFKINDVRENLMSKAEFYDLPRLDTAGRANLGSERAERRCWTIMDYRREGGLFRTGLRRMRSHAGWPDSQNSAHAAEK